VQWAAPSLEHKLENLQNTQDRTHFMELLRAYEFDAAGFAMHLLHEQGVTLLDQAETSSGGGPFRVPIPEHERILAQALPNAIRVRSTWSS
jgi:hypothetical protein